MVLVLVAAVIFYAQAKKKFQNVHGAMLKNVMVLGKIVLILLGQRDSYELRKAYSNDASNRRRRISKQLYYYIANNGLLFQKKKKWSRLFLKYSMTFHNLNQLKLKQLH